MLTDHQLGIYNQGEFDIRCEWGERGVDLLAPISDGIIIVDVLSFSTCVDIAVGRGAIVYPYIWKDERASTFAASVGAELAHPERSSRHYSLSPLSLMHIQPGTRIVLPSPNGSTLSLAARPTPVLAGCLRNARSVALAARRIGRRIGVIPAGERWKDDRSLRPSFEDLVGAGAIISYLDGNLSPEAASALAAFQRVESRLGENLARCSSGKELIDRGYSEDVKLASELNASDCAPILAEASFVPAETCGDPGLSVQIER